MHLCIKFKYSHGERPLLAMTERRKRKHKSNFWWSNWARVYSQVPKEKDRHFLNKYLGQWLVPTLRLFWKRYSVLWGQIFQSLPGQDMRVWVNVKKMAPHSRCIVGKANDFTWLRGKKGCVRPQVTVWWIEMDGQRETFT
jgi:hypothetical protein